MQLEWKNSDVLELFLKIIYAQFQKFEIFSKIKW